MAQGARGSIEIYISWCKRCGIYAAFCPAGVLAQDESGEVSVKNPGHYTGCKLCLMDYKDFVCRYALQRRRAKS